GLEIVGTLHTSAFDLSLAHGRINRARHHFSNAVLKVEKIGRSTFGLAGPNMACGLGFNELGRNADTLAHTLHAAFHYIAHVKFAPYLPHIHLATLVAESGVASDYQKIADARQGRSDFLDDGVGKMDLLR